MKHEYRKHEKKLYLPKQKPVRINVPEFKFFAITGKGDPNEESFAEYVAVLYSLSYGMKMGLKKGKAPEGYVDYTVYPLEGIWDISEEAKQKGIQQFDKADLVFDLMIRQPDFVTDQLAATTHEQVKSKKPHPLLDTVRFVRIEEGECVQMLHVGSYDAEPASFKMMEEFAAREGLRRSSRTHREIYLTDARKVAPEKLKTVLRFKVEKAG